MTPFQPWSNLLNCIIVFIPAVFKVVCIQYNNCRVLSLTPLVCSVLSVIQCHMDRGRGWEEANLVCHNMFSSCLYAYLSPRSLWTLCILHVLVNLLPNDKIYSQLVHFQDNKTATWSTSSASFHLKLCAVASSSSSRGLILSAKCQQGWNLWMKTYNTADTRGPSWLLHRKVNKPSRACACSVCVFVCVSQQEVFLTVCWCSPAEWRGGLS